MRALCGSNSPRVRIPAAYVEVDTPHTRLVVTARSEVELTAPREWLFTPDFVAPEQVRCEKVSPATDVYALGVLLYLLLSGRHPTSPPDAGPPSDRVRAVLAVAPRRLGLGDVDAIVHTALRKDSAERYQNARALGDDLARLLRGERIDARH